MFNESMYKFVYYIYKQKNKVLILRKTVFIIYKHKY